MIITDNLFALFNLKTIFLNLINFEQGEKSNTTQKTVPLAALQSEREKRKEANLALKKIKEEYEAKLKLQDDRLKSLESSKEDKEFEETFKDEEGLSDNERVLLKKYRSLEKQVKQQRTQSLTNEQKALQEQRQRRMIELDKQLKDEGFPGFKRAMLSGEINMQIGGKLKSGLLNDLDVNKESTWVDTFKEDVFPELRKEFNIQSDGLDKSKKKQAKSEANLADKSGNPPKTEKKEEKFPTFEDYIASRRKESLGNV